MMKDSLIKKLVVISGVGVSIGVSVAIVRYFYDPKKSETSSDEDRDVSVELRLERKFLGYIIGKRGATIKRIREETCTSIRLKDQDDEIASIIIRGLPCNVKAASEEIKRLTSKPLSNFTKEVRVPNNAWISVVGLNGEVVRQISFESKASLTVNFSPENKSSDCYISIRGTKEQLEHAMSLIDERIAQGEVMQQSKSVGIAGRSLLENALSPMHNTLDQEVLQSNSADGFTQVYISAVESPSDFWVQLCGPKSRQLDKLINEMTDLYSDNARRSSLAMPAVVVGDFVAACFGDDDSDWYRAVVTSVEKNSTEVTATVRFVDFGDTNVVKLEALYKLKPEFIVLPMQAIRCGLAGVSSVGDHWSVDAVTLFETLTYRAQWKILMAKPVDLIHGASPNDLETSSVPIAVKLVDTNGAADVDIAKELVVAGYAVFTERVNE